MPAAIGLTIIAEVTLIPFGHGPLHDHRIIRDEETGDGRLDTLKVFLGFNAETAHKTYCRQAEQGGQDAISPSSFDSFDSRASTSIAILPSFIWLPAPGLV